MSLHECKDFHTWGNTIGFSHCGSSVLLCHHHRHHHHCHQREAQWRIGSNVELYCAVVLVVMTTFVAADPSLPNTPHLQKNTNLEPISWGELTNSSKQIFPTCPRLFRHHYQGLKNAMNPHVLKVRDSFTCHYNNLHQYSQPSITLYLPVLPFLLRGFVFLIESSVRNDRAPHRTLDIAAGTGNNLEIHWQADDAFSTSFTSINLLE